MGLPDDSTVFNDREHILWTRSTDGGINWDIPAHDASGNFELPDYQPLFNGSLSAIMIGDTFHIAWLDWDQTGQLLPGGHVHHLAVSPNGSVDGPHLVAEINLFFDPNRDNSTTALGLGYGIWQHPTLAYRPAGLLPPPNDGSALYCLWSSPPEDGGGGMADTSAPVGGGRIFPCADIWCAASADNGRFWDAKTNATQTNHPGCNGTSDPCEHEFYISAAAEADSVIYVVSQVQKFPGFQSQGDPGPNTRLSDEWRLYLVPARPPIPVCTLLVDTVPPVITCPNNLVKNTNPGQCEATVRYFAKVNDNCFGASYACTPSSGSNFPVGVTTVTCIASDLAGNKDSCSFSVTVRDLEPPTITCPSAITVNTATGRCDATVDYTPPVASDNCPGPVNVDCSPPSGSLFPIGETTVKCIVADTTGNKDSCQFVVTVNDTQPPAIVCPGNTVVYSDSGRCGAAKMNFAANVSDNCPNAFTYCFPPSGSIFPLGTRRVLCVAKDLYGNFDTCSFAVTVVFVKGDLNRDTILAASDVIREINCVFLGITPPAGDCACDLNCDAAATAADVVLELNATFSGDPFPCP